MSGNIPFISVVMPVRNEARFIADTLGHLLAQDYPRDRFEILVVDGMSDDGTRDIVAKIAAEDARVLLLHNPKRRSSAGRNVGFRAGRGECFVVVDGHCHIPDKRFLRHVAESFARSGAHCLGRPQPLDPPDLTPFQRSVALARASRLGHGGESLIYGDFEGFASPVSNGAAYRREVFERVGYVDEDFDACEDVEFNYRVERAGLKAYTSPRLTVRYYPRESLAALLDQMRRYGRGRTRFYRKHPAALRLSALMPPLFVLGVAAFMALSVQDLTFGLSSFPSFMMRALGLAISAYAVLVALATLRICREHGWGHFWRLPPVFLAVHGGLGFGMWEEFLVPVGRYFRRRRRSEGPIRIAFFIDAILSPTAGTERQLLLLLEGLGRREFKPILCTLQDSPWLRDHFSLCPVHVLDIKSFKNPGTWWKIAQFARWLRKERIDILQVHFWDASLVGIPAAWLARVPGIVAMRKNQGFWMSNKELYLQRMLNSIPDVFVANSENTRQRVHRVEGIPLEKIYHIPNGLDLSVYRGSDRANTRKDKEALGLHPDSPVVGIVANLRPVKRIDVFLRAVELVSNEIPDVQCVIVGEGNERARLDKLARSLGIRDRVNFLGLRTDVPSLLPIFDIGVLCSDSESFSNAVVEYMAAGLPVVATDVGGCREAFGDSPAAVLVQPGDVEGLAQAVITLLNSPELGGFAKNYHRQRVAELFSHSLYVQRYEQLFRSVIQ